MIILFIEYYTNQIEVHEINFQKPVKVIISNRNGMF